MASYDIVTPPTGDGNLYMSKFVVPADGKWHEIALTGKVLHVGTGTHGSFMVSFWALTNTGVTPVKRSFKAFGSGAPLPNDSKVVYIGTVEVPNNGPVWHLFELHGNAPTMVR